MTTALGPIAVRRPDLWHPAEGWRFPADDDVGPLVELRALSHTTTWQSLWTAA